MMAENSWEESHILDVYSFGVVLLELLSVQRKGLGCEHTQIWGTQQSGAEESQGMLGVRLQAEGKRRSTSVPGPRS